jgi:tRNA-2-methylthio-N6-dimethylallyladenosine synthase
VLAAMKRGYTADDYRRLVGHIREMIPGAAVHTDIIVGFPGETEQDFSDTLSLVAEVGFSSSFTFAYSPRAGTPAAVSPDQLPAEVKQERLVRLIALQNEISLKGNQAEVGGMVEVLVEGEAEKAPGLGAGRSRANKLVIFSPTVTGNVGAVSHLVGREVKVLVERAATWSLEGRIVL